MSDQGLILAALLIPLLTAGMIWTLRYLPNMRESASMIGALALGLVCFLLAGRVAAGASPALALPEAFPGIGIAFRLEPLGALFACIAGSLWPLNTLFSIGYMRSLKEKNQTRFYICFTIALMGTMGIAMAANLFTLFVFYEILTISTFPLVAHKGDASALRGARIYLGVLLFTSLGLLLPAIIVTALISGSTDFVAGGLLRDKATLLEAGILLPMFVFGIGKAAMMPLHFWLPAAMVAPTPVSALLHAVAVVKAGVFAILKIAIFIFGPELLEQTPSREPLLMIALAGLVLASLIALTRDNLKARLAYSTIGQLAYVSVGALIAKPEAFAGSALQIMAHAYGKIALFMCAGAIYIATKATKVSQLRQMRPNMPLVFIVFAMGAASVSGLPPFVGVWPKFLLMQGAWQAEQPLIIIGMICSSMLNLAYLLPIAIAGLVPPRSLPGDTVYMPTPLSPFVIAPPALAAIATLILFFAADKIHAFLAPTIHGAGP